MDEILRWPGWAPAGVFATILVPILIARWQMRNAQPPRAMGRTPDNHDLNIKYKEESSINQKTGIINSEEKQGKIFQPTLIRANRYADRSLHKFKHSLNDTPKAP